MTTRRWLPSDGDAGLLVAIKDASVDLVRAFHCLQDLDDPALALHHWLRVLVPGGRLAVSVPDEDDAAMSPGRCKWTFAVHKPVAESASVRSLNVLDLLTPLSVLAEIDQLRVTPWPAAEEQPAGRAIEFVLRKHARAPGAARMARPLPARADLVARALRLYALGEHDAVLDLLERHGVLAARSPDILNAAGAASFALKDVPRAIALYRRAVQLMPGHYDAWCNLGIALVNVEREDEAEAALREAVRLRPAELSFRSELTEVLIRRRSYAEAEALCLTALAEAPEHPLFLSALSRIAMRTGRPAAARPLLSRMAAVGQDNAETAVKAAVMLAHAGFHDDAEQVYRNILQQGPNDTAAFNLSLLLLQGGRFVEGWALYTARAGVRPADPPHYRFVRWQGEPLAGKRILISFEQGFGDEIMMSRYVAELRKAGAAGIGMVCRAPLVPLLKTIEGLELLVHDEGGTMTFRDGQYDYWALAFDLPRFLGTDASRIPGILPGLRALPERVAAWAGELPSGGLRVGVAWKGSELHRSDRERSLTSLAQLTPLWQVPGVHFVSLQKGQGEDEAGQARAMQPLCELGSRIRDFGDTAAIVASLDLVISVDTALVHVAGALGKPCWVMIPHYASDWRWQRDRTDSPWYPTLRLFRQDMTGEWEPVIAAMAGALDELAASGAGGIDEWRAT